MPGRRFLKIFVAVFAAEHHFLVWDEKERSFSRMHQRMWLACARRLEENSV